MESAANPFTAKSDRGKRRPIEGKGRAAFATPLSKEVKSGNGRLGKKGEQGFIGKKNHR